MRALILETLYEWSKMTSRKYFKQNDAWNITIADLMHYPKISLGFHLACFLLKHGFEMQPRPEIHDVFLMLTGIKISVPEEISMPFYLLGNGKQSPYLFYGHRFGGGFVSMLLEKFFAGLPTSKTCLRLSSL